MKIADKEIFFFFFGRIKNNSQIENIFDLTKKAFLVLKNDLFLNFVNNFPFSNNRTNTKLALGYCQTTTKLALDQSEQPSS
jgi:predicted HAD superfamily hydrolase